MDLLERDWRIIAAHGSWQLTIRLYSRHKDLIDRVLLQAYMATNKQLSEKAATDMTALWLYKNSDFYNMLIMKKELLDEYCKWLFDILFELEERTDSTKYNKFHARYIGRVSELLLDVWVNTNNVKYKEVKVLDIEPVNWLKKGMLFINSKFRGKKYEKSL